MSAVLDNGRIDRERALRAAGIESALVFITSGMNVTVPRAMLANDEWFAQVRFASGALLVTLTWCETRDDYEVASRKEGISATPRYFRSPLQALEHFVAFAEGV